MNTLRDFFLNLYGRVLARLVVCYLKLPRISPGALTVLKWIGALLAFAVGMSIVSALAGCHAVPARVTLPSTAPVKTAVAKARADADTTVALAKAVEKSGAQPGSAQVHALTLSATATVNDLEISDRKIDLLDAQLATAQKKEDATLADDVTKTALVSKEKTDWWHLFYWFAAVLVATPVAIALAGAALQAMLRAVAKFMATELVKVGALAIHAVEEIPKVAAVAALV